MKQLLIRSLLLALVMSSVPTYSADNTGGLQNQATCYGLAALGFAAINGFRAFIKLPVLQATASNIRQNKHLKLHQKLEQALRSNSIEKVEEALKEGADPNEDLWNLYPRSQYANETPKIYALNLAIPGWESLDGSSYRERENPRYQELYRERRTNEVKVNSMVKLLLDYGARRFACSVWQTSILYWPIEYNWLKVTKTLLDAGAFPAGNLLADVARHRPPLEMVKLLLQYGAKANDNSLGFNALFSYASHGKKDVVKLLLKHGADMTEVNANASWGHSRPINFPGCGIVFDRHHMQIRGAAQGLSQADREKIENKLTQAELKECAHIGEALPDDPDLKDLVVDYLVGDKQWFAAERRKAG